MKDSEHIWSTATTRIPAAAHIVHGVCDETDALEPDRHPSGSVIDGRAQQGIEFGAVPSEGILCGLIVIGGDPPR
jgi:hypothetical protein